MTTPDYRTFILRPRQIGAFAYRIYVYAWPVPAKTPAINCINDAFWASGNQIAVTHNSAGARAVLPIDVVQNPDLERVLGLPDDCELWHSQSGYRLIRW
jgi:hypothetical protein